MSRQLRQRTPNTSSTTSATSKVLQRKCSCDEHGNKEECTTKTNSLSLQRKPASGIVRDDAPPIVHEVLQSSGKQLDPTTRSVMEPYFGHDFSKVKIHSDAKAAESARAVSADAYTVGQNVVFASGRYSPSQAEGQQLLTHELTHVVQQSASTNHPGELQVGEPDDRFEKEADNKATHFLKGDEQGMHKPQSIPHSSSPVLQRQTPGLPSLVAPLHLSSEQVELDAGESLTAENPKLVSLAASFKQMAAANPREYIKLSSYLSEASKLNSAKAAQESSQIRQRMSAIQNALTQLGVPAESVEIEPATAFSSTGGGQITASLYKSPRALPPMFGTGPGPALGPAAPATAGGGGGASSSIGDMLSFKFAAGPVLFAVELPKSLTIKLPVALSAAKTLSFSLKAESSGEFSFGIALNGLPHVNISAKAALKMDKEKGTSGSAGLEITTTKTVCNAPSPESLKAKITSAGDKLKKAMTELEAAKDEDRLMKLADIAGAIGEMYDAVDKAKSACKEVPRATFNLGYQGPLSPGGAPGDDPSKQPASFFGGSVTLHF